jgi:hypothetical protein
VRHKAAGDVAPVRVELEDDGDDEDHEEKAPVAEDSLDRLER